MAPRGPRSGFWGQHNVYDGVGQIIFPSAQHLNVRYIDFSSLQTETPFLKNLRIHRKWVLHLAMAELFGQICSRHNTKKLIPSRLWIRLYLLADRLNSTFVSAFRRTPSLLLSEPSSDPPRKRKGDLAMLSQSLLALSNPFLCRGLSLTYSYMR